jgi:uncharacterized protein (TIGR03067 family)
MTIRAITLAPILLLAPISPGRAADDDAIKKEMEKLQGVWRVESMEVFGEKNDAKSLEKARLTIAGDKFVLKDGNKIESEGTFKIVMVKGKMRQTDLTGTDGKSTAYNIAEWIDDDTFRTCISGGTRPTDFSSTKQNSQILIVFKREKKR